LTRRLGVAFRHEARAAFLPIRDEFDFGKVAQSVNDRDVAFSRYAENVAHGFIAKAFGDGMTSKHSVMTSGSFPVHISSLHGGCQCRSSGDRAAWIEPRAD
jgi:hypothetical protein